MQTAKDTKSVQYLYPRLCRKRKKPPAEPDSVHRNPILPAASHIKSGLTTGMITIYDLEKDLRSLFHLNLSVVISITSEINFSLDDSTFFHTAIFSLWGININPIMAPPHTSSYYNRMASSALCLDYPAGILIARRQHTTVWAIP